jgi:dienelactone hydrolase
MPQGSMQPSREAARPARGNRMRLAAALAACVAAVGPAAAAALASGPPASTPGTTPPSVLTLSHVHNFRTSTRWVTYRRGVRVLPTMIVTPVVSPGVVVPVMEFAHGWHSNPRVYAAMLRAWASAGFLVIAPTSPGMARGRGLLPQGAASMRQAGDLPVVLTAVLASRLPVVPDPAEIALAGHSDGGCTVADMAFNRRYRDNRIAAYLIFSGGRTAVNTGRRFVHANPKPVFIADSYADQFGDFPSAGGFYRQARPPKIMVGIARGETHLPPWSVSTLFHQHLWNATVDFASWAFTGRGAALEAMLGDLHVRGFGVNLTT